MEVLKLANFWKNVSFDKHVSYQMETVYWTVVGWSLLRTTTEKQRRSKTISRCSATKGGVDCCKSCFSRTGLQRCFLFFTFYIKIIVLKISKKNWSFLFQSSYMSAFDDEIMISSQIQLTVEQIGIKKVFFFVF